MHAQMETSPRFDFASMGLGSLLAPKHQEPNPTRNSKPTQRLNRTEDAHMFYFFYESRRRPSADPVVLWMTGGFLPRPGPGLGGCGCVGGRCPGGRGIGLLPLGTRQRRLTTPKPTNLSSLPIFAAAFRRPRLLLRDRHPLR